MHARNEDAMRAREILNACEIAIAAPFDALSGRQIDALLAYLDQHQLNKYGALSKLRPPPGSVNSRVRLFYDLLQRSAAPRQPRAAASR